MERLTGLLGMTLILGLALLLSNNRRAINLRVVLSGLALQIGLALFILKTTPGQQLFSILGKGITKVLDFSKAGGEFVFGPLIRPDVLGPVLGPQYGFIFMFQILPTIIFVAVLVSIAYYFGIMQQIVRAFAWVMKRVMNVSGSEALSNVASAFVGQVEAQILIKPYLKGMTQSELLASMSGSMACIAGGVMAVYIGMGVPAPYLLAASIMAAPGALVIAKIVFPETEKSETDGQVRLAVKDTHTNVMDAISHGAGDGMRIALNVIAMLIGVIALIELLNYLLHFAHTDLRTLLGYVFYPFAWAMGVPSPDVQSVASLMGQKMAINEFVAYSDLTQNYQQTLTPKGYLIASFALCGFANFSSVAIQLGGIGALEPSRRADIARLGFKALICGTLASYMSATIAGILY